IGKRRFHFLCRQGRSPITGAANRRTYAVFHFSSRSQVRNLQYFLPCGPGQFGGREGTHASTTPNWRGHTTHETRRRRDGERQSSLSLSLPPPSGLPLLRVLSLLPNGSENRSARREGGEPRRLSRQISRQPRILTRDPRSPPAGRCAAAAAARSPAAVRRPDLEESTL
ncbi:hypothetical protein PVAP13_6NG102803, partial [Panicum virgatum]